MSEQDDAFADVTSIPYDQEQISGIVRRILFGARNRGEAVKLLVDMLRKLERGVCWTDGTTIHFCPDGSRTSKLTLRCGDNEIAIDVCVNADEIQQRTG